MNTLKPLLIIAIVSGIGYGVWSRVNRKPDAPPPPVADDWAGTPKVQLGDGAGTAWSATPQSASPNGAPPFNVNPGNANPGNANPGTVAGNLSAPPAAGGPPAFAPPPGAGQPLAGAPPFGAAPAMPSEIAGAPPGDGANWRAGGNAPPPDQAAAGAPPAAGYGVMPAGGVAADPAVAGSFPAIMDRVRQDLDSGRLAEGLTQLSAWYDNPQLGETEQQQLCALLDQVAGTVIYSTKDFLEPAYEVQPGDRLDEIGDRYKVPWQLLAKINGVSDPQALRPGDRLKMVRGPFDAIIHLERRQLTLMLNGAYAGRFAIGVGHDFPPREGQYSVILKMPNPPYHGLDRNIAGGDPANPLGTRWIGLGTTPTEDSGYGIHGINDPNALGRPDQAGCIALGPRDVDDLFDILSVGSRITIRR